MLFKLTVAALALLLAGCATTSSAPAARGPAEGPVRTDAAPLIKRFPALGEPQKVAWQSGRFGDSRAPGPSTYWIDAVVEVDAETARTLRQAAPQTRPAPEVTEDLRPSVPASTWRGGDALDGMLSHDDWSVEAVVSDGTTVVLTAVGEG